jgi:hypothetical protein
MQTGLVRIQPHTLITVSRQLRDVLLLVSSYNGFSCKLMSPASCLLALKLLHAVPEVQELGC